MKRRISFFAVFVISLSTMLISCKEDVDHSDPLTLTDGMSMTVSIKNSVYTPLLFDNFVQSLERDSLNGTILNGRRLVLESKLNELEKLKIVLTNWEGNGGHPDGVVPKAYIFGPVDTTTTSITLGDSTYSDKPYLIYSLSSDYIYVVDNGLPGSVNVTYCNPIKKSINGNFTATCVALPPNSDTVFIQGSFTGMKYYKKLTN